jgi:hypothetical protein
MYVAAFYKIPKLAESRNSFQCVVLVFSIIRVHPRRFVRISVKRTLVVGWFLSFHVQLSCHLLRALLIFNYCVLSSGVNHLLAYGDGLLNDVYFSTAFNIAWMKSFIIWSS